MRYTVIRATPEKKRSNRILLSYRHLVNVDATEQIFQRPLSMLLFSLTSVEVVVTSTTSAPRSKNDTLPMKGDALVQGARGRPQASRSGGYNELATDKLPDEALLAVYKGQGSVERG